MRFDRLPASQKAAPLDGERSPPTVVVTRPVGPLAAIFRLDQKFTLPAPPPINPPSIMNVAPVCSASFNCDALMLVFACISSAAPPLTMPAAMLVPLSCMYAFDDRPTQWRNP